MTEIVCSGRRTSLDPGWFARRSAYTGWVVGLKRAGRLRVVADTDASVESIDEAVEALLFSEWYYTGLVWNAG